MSKFMLLFLLFLLVLTAQTIGANTRSDVIDQYGGFVLYCACQGRFGNQADHFLGAMAFAKSLNRTLILSPWVEYLPGQKHPLFVPFNDYFDVSKVVKYVKAVTLEDWLQMYMDEVWSVEDRVIFCWGPSIEHPTECPTRFGNPFTAFWDYVGAKFTFSVFYNQKDLSFYEESAAAWINEYPPQAYPVIAFTGAPSTYPVRAEHESLQRFLVHSPPIMATAHTFAAAELDRPFIGIHLRNNRDWSNVCEMTPTKSLFSSAQCLGHRNEHGAEVTREMCEPAVDQVAELVRRVVEDFDAQSVFVASDYDHHLPDLRRALPAHVKVVKREPDEPHVALQILQEADHFIGNCLSSFSAFVTRARREHNSGVKKESSFFGRPYTSPKHKSMHTEL